MKSGTCAALVGFLTLVLMTKVSSGVVHHVGGAAEWTNYDVATLAVPDYNDWSSRTYVHVGDSLVFSYAPTYHDVVSLPSLEAYETCDFKGAIVLDDGSSGSFTWTAPAPGTFYFSCDKSVEGLGTHCSAGQKVAITVRAFATSAPSPSQRPRPVHSSPPTSNPPAGSVTRSPQTNPATPTPAEFAPTLSPEQPVSEIPPTVQPPSPSPVVPTPAEFVPPLSPEQSVSEIPPTVLPPSLSPVVPSPGQGLRSPKLSPDVAPGIPISAAPHAFTPLVSPVAAPGTAPRIGRAPAFSPPAPPLVPAAVSSPPTPPPVTREGTPGYAPTIPPSPSEIPTEGTPPATQAPTGPSPAPDFPTTLPPAESPEQSVPQSPVDETQDFNHARGHFEHNSWSFLLFPVVLLMATMY